MSRNTRPHLAPVQPSAPANEARKSLERVELPTGGRRDVDGLLRELARAAFPGALVGYSFELDARLGARCVATVAVHERFTADQLDAGRVAITRALLALGVLQAPRAATTLQTPAAAEASTTEDGAESQPPPSPPT